VTGNAWVTGQCWLSCLRPDARVTWIGPVHGGGTAYGASAAMYACAPCLRTLTDLLRDAVHARDHGLPPAPSPRTDAL
jgi:hypothetical protein